MKSSHTPGPWETTPVWRDPELSGRGPIKQMKYRINVIAGNGRHCPAITNGYTIEESEANARLIAAAPELLEACKFILSQLDPNGDHPKTQCVLNSDCLSPKETDDQSVVEYLKAAISKAEGNA